jgi:hypothetical protein
VRAVSNPDLDAKLRAYLEEHARDREEGNTIANLRLGLHQLQLDVNEVAAEQKVMKLRLDRHGKDIRELKQHVYSRESDEFDTGVHQVEDLRRHLAEKQSELEERRRDSVWWKRKKAEWVVAALGAIAMAMLTGTGGAIWFFVTHGGK